MTARAWISKVAPAHSPLQMLLPVQSWDQGLSIVGLAGGMIALLMGAVALLGKNPPDVGVFIGGFIGMLPSIYSALPGRLEIRTRGAARQLLGEVQGRVRSLGYKVETVEEPGRAWRYRMKHPRLLRWRENEVVLRLVDEQWIVAEGPKFALRLLSRRLARIEDFEETTV